MRFHKKIVLLENLLFKGYRHSKRGQGINILPLWITSEIKSLTLIDDICENYYKYKKCKKII